MVLCCRNLFFKKRCFRNIAFTGSKTSLMMKVLKRRTAFPLLFIFLTTTFLTINATGQQATVREVTEKIKTYPFSDPNPIPVLGINKKVAPFYPYFMFDGYTDRATTKDWKVVKLEN